MIVLSDTEMAALKEALDNYLPELNYELARVKLERDRHHLVELERSLRVFRNRLADEAAGREAH